jgi:hypothetical protein
MHQAPAGQKIHVPKYPPDNRDNSVRGIPTNPIITDRRMDFLENNFTHRAGDIWVITYQKVGTTWTQYIVSLLIGNQPDTSLMEFLLTCPWPEIDSGVIATSTDALQRSAVTAKRPRCFKSHWPRQGFFRTIPTSSKIIYVLRDAESVAISFWNHIHNFFAFYWVKEGDMTWDQYFEKWFHGDHQNGGYMEHVASWWDERDKENMFFLRYEELKADTAGTIRRIAKFIDVAVNDTRVAEILDATSKDSMRKWNEGLIDKIFIKMGVMKGDHVRKDGAQQKVAASDAQRAKMVDKYRALLEPKGVPYEYMFASTASRKT